MAWKKIPPHCKYEKQEAEKIFRNKNSNNEKLQVGQKKEEEEEEEKQRERDGEKRAARLGSATHGAPRLEAQDYTSSPPYRPIPL